MWKKIIAICLCVILTASMAGCGKGKKTKQEKKGGYVQKEVKLPDMDEGETYLGSSTKEENNISIYTVLEKDNKGEIYSYKNENGEFKRTKVEWQAPKNSAWKVPVRVWDANDGKCYFQFVNELYVLQDGKLVDVSPKQWKRTTPEKLTTVKYSIANVEVLKNGNIVYQESYENAIRIYYVDTKKDEKLPEMTAKMPFAVYDNTVVSFVGGNKIESYDTVNDKVTMELETDVNGQDASLFAKVDGSIYITSANGLQRIQPKGTIVATVLDGKETIIGSKDYQTKNLYGLDGSEENYGVVLKDENNGGTKVYNFSYDKDYVQTIEHEFSVYSLWENPTMKEAIVRYSYEHPEVKINYVVENSEATSASYTDVIRTLNTEILAGNAADVFLLDGLPMDSYIEKGVLKDLSKVLEPIESKDGFMENIKKNYTKDKKQYAMPLKFGLPIYLGKTKAVQTAMSYEGLNEYATKLKKGDYYFDDVVQNEFVESIVYSYYNQLSQSDGTIDEAKFSQFLENLDATLKKSYVEEYIESENRESGLDSSAAVMTQLSKIIYDNPIYYLLGKGNLTLTKLQKVRDLRDVEAVQTYAKNNSDYGKDCTYESINNMYMPSGLVGVNNKTKEEQAVSDFLTFLYSSDFQSIEAGDGFAMNKKALVKCLAQTNYPDMQTGGNRSDGTMVTVNSKPLTKEQQDKMMQMFKNLETPMNSNAIVMTMLVEEVKDYCNGKSDLNETVKKVTTGINRYLSEQ